MIAAARLPTSDGFMELVEPRPGSALSHLSSREIEIAQFVSAGLSNKEIGQALHISHHTVSTHLRRIFSKLDVGCRVQLCHIVLADARSSELRASKSCV